MTPVTEELLMTYLDGELDPEIAAQVRDAVACSSDLQELERELRTLMGDVTLAFSAASASQMVTAAPTMQTASSPAATSNTPLLRMKVDCGHAVASPASMGAPAAWRRRMTYAVAAVVLLAVGVSGGRFLATTRSETPGSVVATQTRSHAFTPTLSETAPGAENRGTRQPTSDVAAMDAVKNTSPVAQPDGAAPGVTVASAAELRSTATPRSELLPIEPTPSTNARSPISAPRVDVSVLGARAVAAREFGGGTGGVQTFEINGTRVELSYGATVGGERPELSRTAIAELASSTENSMSVSGARTSSGTNALSNQQGAGTLHAVASCPEGLRVRDETTGVVFELRGSLACRELAKLAQAVRIVAVR